MSEDMATTEEVRDAYTHVHEGSIRDGKGGWRSNGSELEEEFDRWLYSIRQEAYAEGFGDGGINAWDFPERWQL